MRLYTHSNGKRYPYREKTRLEYLLEGILLAPFIIGFFAGYRAIKSKRGWNELITHEEPYV